MSSSTPPKNESLDDDDDEDEDYVPDEEVSGDDESGSEVASTIDSLATANAPESEKQSTSKKRKSIEEAKNSTSKHAKVNQDIVDKKKADEIWSSFLKDVNSKQPNAVVSSIESTKPPQSQLLPQPEPKKSFSSSIKSSFAIKTTSINDIKDLPKLNDEKNSKAELKSKSSGGLASILEKIDQQPKMSTLQKSKLDWDNFKRSENLQDDLNRHSKDKDSYLERQAFLQRTDLRQFELEKELRNKERKLRESKN